MSIQGQNSAETSQILGIDFGRAKIGLAMASEEARMAFRYGILENSKDLVDSLGKIMVENEVRKIVIGVPKFEKGDTIETEAKKLGEELENKFGAKVFFQDEMFTTKMAQANLIEKGEKGIGKIDDSEAARIILQDWLDSDPN
jgi:putative transcription antitermination factor YqgF